MKKLLLSMLMGMMLLGAAAQGGKFTVKGTFEGRGDSVKFVVVDPFTRKPIMSEIRAITGEMLEVSFDLKKAEMLYVELSGNGNKGYMNAPAIPGEEVEFYRDGAPVTHLRGSQFYLDYDVAQESIMEPAIKVMNMRVPRRDADENEVNQFNAAYQDFLDAMTAYVKAHPDQEASAALIMFVGEVGAKTKIEDIKALEACLTERVRNSSAADLYKECVARDGLKRKLQAHQNVNEGDEAPDFTLEDINGNPLSLSSLRGKWVVIDFWGSWCKWCIQGVPLMKEYYAKYQDKLEILGVDCRDTVEKWKEAVAEHGLSWQHVYCDINAKENNPFKLYSVRGFPTKIVIDPEGKVTKIVKGEDPVFYEYLDEILK